MRARAIGRWVFSDDTMIFYANGGDYTGSDFERWMSVIEAGGFRYYIGATGDNFHVTVKERDRTGRTFKRSGVPFAVVTDNMLVRGFNTALGWFGIRTIAYPWDKTEQAFAWLGHPADACERLAKVMRDLRDRVDEEVRRRDALAATKHAAS